MMPNVMIGGDRRSQRPQLVCLAAALLMLAACGEAFDTGDLHPDLSVENGTELTVSVFVNGQQVAEYEPMAAGGVEADLPPLPWRVEARTASGRLLTSIDVAPGDIVTEEGPNGATHQTTALGRADLSCGRLSVWVGDVVPGGPAPGPNPGRPGDCAP